MNHDSVLDDYDAALKVAGQEVDALIECLNGEAELAGVRAMDPMTQENWIDRSWERKVVSGAS